MTYCNETGFFTEIEMDGQDGQSEATRLTHKPDGSVRHPGVAGVLKHFRFEHLPERLQAISKPCGELAIAMANELPENPDLTVGLRELLTAKDNFVRAMLG